MDSVFGVPITTILLIVLTIMGLCLLTTAIIALRNRVIFKMALRNIPRRKAQTVLIMVGLMLATVIIAAALTTGDTLDYSITRASYEGLGQTDETIAFVGDTDNEGEVSTNNVPIPASIADELEARFANDPDIEAIMPLLTIGVPAVNLDARLSEPLVIMTGVDVDRLDDFGGMRTPNGRTIDFASLPAGAGVISDDLAKNIDAQVGDQIAFFYNNQPQTIEVGAIASGSILTGYDSSSVDSSDLLGIAVPLAWLQELTGLQGQARVIAVSNAGGVEAGAERSDAAAAKLKEALDTIEGGGQLGVNTIKQDAVEGAEQFGNIFMSFFLVMGLFSVAAGVLLIFLIFMMLAAERRSEMGMARAVGMKRRHLIQGFIAEGTAYDLGAAFIGAAAGVGVAFLIAGIMGSLIGQFLSIHPHATWQSLLVAYALGVSVTFLTIVFASIRSSRLNIVQAIRDLPEFKTSQRLRPRRKNWNPLHLIALGYRGFRYYVGWSPVVVLGGALLMLQGASAQSLFFFSLGLSLAGLGLALFLRRFLPDRLVFTTIAAAMLVFWLSPDGLLDPILPELNGDFKMFFLSGIFMVTYATLIIMWNAEIIVGVVALVGRGFSRWLPAVKTAVAYPLAAKGRTGMTIAMFSLVIFSLVTLTTINRNFTALFSTDEADAGWDIRVVTNPANPVGDLRSELSGSGDVNVDDIAAVGQVSSIAYFNSHVRNPGDGEWKRYGVNGMGADYIADAEIPLQARAEGYATDADVWAAIAADPSLAVVDAFALDTGSDFGEDPDAFKIDRSVQQTDGVIPSFQIELQSPRSGKTGSVTVIGVIDSKVSTLFGLYLPAETLSAVYGAPDFETLFVKLSDTATVDPAQMAQGIESALLEKGAQASSIADDLEEQLSIQNGFLSLLQGFMGLGLLVGIAALGVISFRSVVERRQQIGMLRAIGYQKQMVAASFLLESLVIAALGVLSGTVLAIILSYNLINSPDFQEGAEFTGFVIPWNTIVFFVVASLIAAGFMTWVPARKASSVPIAEALRYE